MMEAIRADAPVDPVMVTGLLWFAAKLKTMPLVPTAPPMAVLKVRSVVAGSVPLKLAL